MLDKLIQSGSNTGMQTVDITKFVFPIIRRVQSPLFSVGKFVGMQLMPMPSSRLFYMNFEEEKFTLSRQWQIVCPGAIVYSRVTLGTKPLSYVVIATDSSKTTLICSSGGMKTVDTTKIENSNVEE